MNNDRGLCRPNLGLGGDGADMGPRRNAPDPQALAIALEMQGRLQPAKVILLGSRAAGDHHHDSDVDLMAVAPDEAAAAAAKETLRNLLDGKYDVPVVNVHHHHFGMSSGAQRRWPNPGPGRLPATA